MDDKQISNYIQTHGRFINNAARILFGRMPQEDIEDAKQELSIVMLKCLRRYEPEKGVPLDAYVNNSIRKKVYGLLQDYIAQSSPCIGKDKKKVSIISMQSIRYSDEGDEYLSDSIVDEADIVELMDARLITDDLMKGLAPDLRLMVKLWSEHWTLKCIGAKFGITYECVRSRIKAALTEMRILIDDDERKKRLL